MEEWILYIRYYGQSSSVEPPTQRWLQPIAGCVQCDSSHEMEWPVAERRGWAIEVWIVDRTEPQSSVICARFGRVVTEGCKDAVLTTYGMCTCVASSPVKFELTARANRVPGSRALAAAWEFDTSLRICARAAVHIKLKLGRAAI